MEATFPGKLRIDFLRLLSGVDHAQHLMQPLELLGQLGRTESSGSAEGDPAEQSGFLQRFGAQFYRGIGGAEFPEDGAQDRLGGGAQHSAGVVVLH